MAELIAMCPKWIKGGYLTKHQMCVLATLEGTKPLLRFLRNHSHCWWEQMDVLGVVDHLGETERFELSYGLRSMQHFNIKMTLC